MPEPADLSAQLKQLLAAPLDEEERRVYEDDGVIVVRGLVPDRALIHRLESEARVAQTCSNEVCQPIVNAWLVHGGLRAMVRDGPFAAVAASILGHAEVRILQTNVLIKNNGSSGEVESNFNRWHNDLHSWHNAVPTKTAYTTVWLTLNDEPHALEFLLGSHKVEHSCVTNLIGKQHGFTTEVDQDCIMESFARNLSHLRGAPALQAYSFAAGDAALFHGKAWHRGFSKQSRVAVGFRFLPASSRYEGEITQDPGLFAWARYAPRECDELRDPLFPVVYPSANSTVLTAAWPVIPTRWDAARAAVHLMLFHVFGREFERCAAG